MMVKIFVWKSKNIVDDIPLKKWTTKDGEN